ncbi:MAG: hypothetical protein HYV02_07600 [Deltaproteobacteria bacterium]|nr:hypothetical protein [Deltaproteobacteria bacterium]
MTSPTLHCETPELQQWFHQLREDGVPLHAFDGGYGVAQATPDPFAPERVVVGKEDALISCAEIAEVVFARWERYRALITKATGRDIPWDLPPDVTKRVDWIRREVQAEWKPDTVAFTQHLGYALYMYALLPNAEQMPYYRQYQQAWLARVTHRLRLVGLEPVAERIMARGGLGLGSFRGDLPLEGTAMEALQAQQGHCTEKGKVLFGLFARARLSPFVLLMSVPQTYKAWNALFPGMGAQFTPSPDEELLGHVVLSQQTSPKTVYSYDFQAFSANHQLISPDIAPYAVTLSVREFFLTDLHNRVAALRDQKQYAAARRVLESAKRLGPSFLDARFKATEAALAPDHETRQALIAEGLQILPNDPHLQLQRCKTLTDVATQVECLLPLAAHLSAAHAYVAPLLMRNGRVAEALPYLETLTREGSPTERRDHAVLLAHHYAADGRDAEAIRYFTMAHQLDPTNADVCAMLATHYQTRKTWHDAEQWFQRATRLADSPTHRSLIMLQAIPTLMALDNKALAKHYLLRNLQTDQTMSATADLRAYHEAAREAVVAFGFMQEYMQQLEDEIWRRPWAEVFVVDLQWRHGHQEEALARATAFSIADESPRAIAAFKADSFSREGRNIVEQWELALRVLPEDFWHRAPAGLVNFYRAMARWQKAWGNDAAAARALQHVQQHTPTPSGSDGPFRTP